MAARAKTRTDVLASGRERVRTGPWRGDRRIAYLAPLPDAPPPSAAFLQRCLSELAARGFGSVITAALSVPERHVFYNAGFRDAEQLRLLTHDLQAIPVLSPVPTRRARRGDRNAVLAVDAVTFSPFWRLDGWGLDQAVAATPAARFRVAADGDRIVGYAITGRAGSDGYLQRLAVHPAFQRAGRGRALALDGLHWLRRKGATRALVNTQVGNTAAFDLYVGLGFKAQANNLVVLRRELG
ncbi:MAG TPA: GNAT family N-acetyltransferase [Acidimicrobiales bacterium]|nr:GNAT family N-acetyltransferase [Acidimicrobiales bacterium]